MLFFRNLGEFHQFSSMLCTLRSCLILFCTGPHHWPVLRKVSAALRKNQKRTYGAFCQNREIIILSSSKNCSLYKMVWLKVGTNNCKLKLSPNTSMGVDEALCYVTGPTQLSLLFTIWFNFATICCLWLGWLKDTVIQDNFLWCKLVFFTYFVHKGSAFLMTFYCLVWILHLLCSLCVRCWQFFPWTYFTVCLR